MDTKLTLRMDDELVAEAKSYAARHGKSVSRMFGDFIGSLRVQQHGEEFPPVTGSLLGVMRGCRVSEADYRRHLSEKHS